MLNHNMLENQKPNSMLDLTTTGKMLPGKTVFQHQTIFS